MTSPDDAGPVPPGTVPPDPVPARRVPPGRVPPVPADPAPAGRRLLPEQSREDTDAAWGDYPERDDERLYRDRPPHWDDF